jgi:hypothetical protein
MHDFKGVARVCCRAVTAVLCAAGNLKRAFPTAPEDVLMLRAINDGTTTHECGACSMFLLTVGNALSMLVTGLLCCLHHLFRHTDRQNLQHTYHTVIPVD